VPAGFSPSRHSEVPAANARPPLVCARPLGLRSANNINKDLALAVACKEDAAKFCTTDNLFPEPGAVLTCLRHARSLRL